MSTTCIILEDQAPARHLLEDYVKRHAGLELVGATALPSVAREMFRETPADLLFLDLKLPQTDGFAFLRDLPKKPVTIVTTAFPNRALEGFDMGVADYLVKPIAYPRFCTAIDRVQLLLAAREDNSTIAIPLGRNSYRNVPSNDIYWLSADDDYVLIHTGQGDIHVPGPLSDWEGRLSENKFRRIHRSHIVNTDHITERNGNKVTIEGKEFSIGAKFRNDT
ncbi:response regulator transcription factor [Rhodobacteraceae bacterium B1Z28]|uniref:Response regulator transcription factor n=1 Tax=Ruegeria haliotis TaxID=2747601 RepID=A0ABX2PUB9_9RHOB|nr:LytTR family DNA-binding domain-containing protein [Ruegeria haliotis]NVO56732.1 response regulator transcription factor [Ruegeria haliotis]